MWGYKTTKQLSSIDSVVEVILNNRNYTQINRALFLNPNYLSSIGDPYTIPDMSKAVVRIKQAIERNEHIVIYGDYDIDGITATALLYDFLGQLGAKVECYIPDRFEEGYGLNKAALLSLKQKGADLIITVDCGISSVAEIAEAAKNKLDIIVTDHHVIPDKLPVGSVALINPKLGPKESGYYELAGVGVAFLIAKALSKAFGRDENQDKWLLDLVALGTICDVVPLTGVNWLLARYGLIVINKTRRIGLRALIDVAGVTQHDVSSEDVGFRLGPRLNAAGRLEHARKALELLITDDIVRATQLSIELNKLNTERKNQTDEIFDSASKQASKQNRSVIVLADKNWSQGVVGIVASRIVERYAKPTLLLQILNDETAKGSARSTRNYSMIDALNYAQSNIVKFGGHHFAAGLTIKTSNIASLHDKLDEYMSKSAHIKEPKLSVDAAIDPILLEHHELYLALESLKPFGSEHAEPIFSTNLRIVERRLVGKDKKHVKLLLRGPNQTISAIGFSLAEEFGEIGVNSLVEVAFRLRINDYRGIVEPELYIEGIRIR